MTGLDKTGPMGQGSQTGRKIGRCGAENSTINEPRQGRRFGRGNGLRNRFRLSDHPDFAGRRGFRFVRGRGKQE
ncbi:MAG TPA: DUF5320 domain-containing protein [Draconibacterium sp.]|nr:DUF5320 domain-containing protein [Draconibacterium sp.]